MLCVVLVIIVWACCTLRPSIHHTARIGCQQLVGHLKVLNFSSFANPGITLKTDKGPWELLKYVLKVIESPQVCAIVVYGLHWLTALH